MKLLIINPIVRYFDYPRHVPLGELQLMAILDRDHPNVKFQFYDANAYRVDSTKNVEVMPGLEGALSMEYDAIAIGGLITSYNYIKLAVRKCKQLQPRTPIIAGGGFISAI